MTVTVEAVGFGVALVVAVGCGGCGGLLAGAVAATGGRLALVAVALGVVAREDARGRVVVRADGTEGVVPTTEGVWTSPAGATAAAWGALRWLACTANPRTATLMPDMAATTGRLIAGSPCEPLLVQLRGGQPRSECCCADGVHPEVGTADEDVVLLEIGKQAP
ncbi:MAG: hypothetical protein JWO12_2436 [Frankiales bacterium]|nr:hypothetical protein [Frankiales bacterium]